MRNRFLIAFLLVIFIACNKDKFKTEPQVTIKSISPTTVHSGDIITMKSEYSDDEGDLDSIFLVYKWYNGATAVRHDTLPMPFSLLNVPDKTREADLNIQFEYNTSNFQNTIAGLGGVPRDTTASFGLILKDKAGHRSEYKESDKIRLIKP